MSRKSHLKLVENLHCDSVGKRIYEHLSVRTRLECSDKLLMVLMYLCSVSGWFFIVVGY